MSLKWENLRFRLCPYCDKDLIIKKDHAKCSECYFIIDLNRMHSIVANRAYPELKGLQRNKWQNLKEDRCPIVGCESSVVLDTLIEMGTKRIIEIMKCTGKHCSFFIKCETLERILNDKNHAINFNPLDREMKVERREVDKIEDAFRYGKR